MKSSLQSRGPGFYERLGISYFQRLSARRTGHAAAFSAEEDDRLVARARQIALVGSAMAFGAGAVSGLVSSYVDLRFEDAPWFVHYGLLIAAVLVLALLEMFAMFFISLSAVHRIALQSGLGLSDDEDRLVREMLPGLLSRAALEIPDPLERVLDVDPLAAVSKRRLALVSLLYKMKVFLSKFIAKQVLRRALGRAIFRVFFSYAAVLITGLWNAFVIFKVAQEARLRLFGAVIAKHLMAEVMTTAQLSRLSRSAQLGCLQAVGNSVVLARTCHPNMLLLLRCLSARLEADPGLRYDSWSDFLATLGQVNPAERAFLLDLLCVAAAFDGKFSRLERKMLKEAFQEHTAVYTQRIEKLTRLIRRGRTNEALALCRLDFEFG